MPAHASVKASDSHDTLKSSIGHSGFSAQALTLQHAAMNPFIIRFLRHADLRAPAATLKLKHQMDPEPDICELLASMPAIHLYKLHPQRPIIHEITGLNV